MDSKHSLPTVCEKQLPPRQTSKCSRRTRTAGICLGLLAVSLFATTRPLSCVKHLIPSGASEPQVKAPKCPQVEPLFPGHSTDKLAAMDKYIQSEKYLNISVERLSGAVKIPTMSFDDMGPADEDPRFEVFFKFAEYLKTTFPHVHAKLDLKTVNVHGLVYTWVGKDTSLKPTVLMAHQDVVPVPETTIPSWTHPPFDGFFDGEYVWGRGSWDCKDQLTSILEAVEELIKAGFSPKRTVIIALGFDEEISGTRGAGSISKHLVEEYGKDSVAIVVDEGAVNTKKWGAAFAVPGAAEKGMVDVNIVVRMPGGHSSIPSAHTGIGVIAELISLIESNPYEPRLYDENPFLGLLQCGLEHGPDFPPQLKKLLAAHDRLKKGDRDPLAAELAQSSGLETKYLFTTSLAVDLISGGAKINALPERTTATVDHRLNVGERISDVLAKHKLLAKQIAAKYNLTLHAFDPEASETPSSITLTTRANALEPAPVSPTSIDGGVNPYAILSGTTRALYGKDLVVAPGIMTGNTDTRYYWDLTRYIFRYSPGWDGKQEGLGNIHTVDEHIAIKSHLNGVRWFSLFIRNMDEAKMD